MTPEEWTLIRGVLKKGYGVASGPSPDYPYGALQQQLPIFKSRGLDLLAYFRGTLNIDIRPFIFQLARPEYTFRDVHWTDLHPPEHFSFARCRVVCCGAPYDGWIYYPHPETKRRNFQSPSLLGVFAPRIPDIRVGQRVEVHINPQRVTLIRQPRN
jgi:hypothetical protein